MNDIQKLELMKEYFSLIEKSLHIVRIALSLKISDDTQEEFNNLLDQAGALNREADKILEKVHEPEASRYGKILKLWNNLPDFGNQTNTGKHELCTKFYSDIMFQNLTNEQIKYIYINSYFS